MTRHQGFKSKAQARYLLRVHPELALDMAQHTPTQKPLPERAPIKAKHHRHRRT